MNIQFRHTLSPCVFNSTTVWHTAHGGWVWDVIRPDTGEYLGVFYCTLLCAEGCIVHFDTIPGVHIPPKVFLSSIKKGIAMVRPSCDVIFATVPKEKYRLIRILQRIGFRHCPEADYSRDGEEVIFLHYLGSGSDIVQ